MLKGLTYKMNGAILLASFQRAIGGNAHLYPISFAKFFAEVRPRADESIYPPLSVSDFARSNFCEKRRNQIGACLTPLTGGPQL